MNHFLRVPLDYSLGRGRDGRHIPHHQYHAISSSLEKMMEQVTLGILVTLPTVMDTIGPFSFSYATPPPFKMLMYLTVFSISGDFNPFVGTSWRKIRRRFVKALVQVGLPSQSM